MALIIDTTIGFEKAKQKILTYMKNNEKSQNSCFDFSKYKNRNLMYVNISSSKGFRSQPKTCPLFKMGAAEVKEKHCFAQVSRETLENDFSHLNSFFQ